MKWNDISNSSAVRMTLVERERHRLERGVVLAVASVAARVGLFVLVRPWLVDSEPLAVVVWWT